jgi:hypothetical protein
MGVRRRLSDDVLSCGAQMTPSATDGELIDRVARIPCVLQLTVAFSLVSHFVIYRSMTYCTKLLSTRTPLCEGHCAPSQPLGEHRFSPSIQPLKCGPPTKKVVKFAGLVVATLEVVTRQNWIYNVIW